MSSNGIGVPFNVQHTSHVSFDFQWTGEKNPEEIFELQDKLGQGYVFFTEIGVTCHATNRLGCVISAWGRVIKAVHKELKFPLAIKIIQQTNKILQQSLQTEVEILKKCKSPLVVNYFGTILRDNEVWVRQNNRIFTRAYFWVLT